MGVNGCESCHHSGTFGPTPSRDKASFPSPTYPDSPWDQWGLRQLINKQNQPQDTPVLSLCTGFLSKIPFDLSIELQIIWGNKGKIVFLNPPHLWTSRLPLGYFYTFKLHKCKMWASHKIIPQLIDIYIWFFIYKYTHTSQIIDVSNVTKQFIFLRYRTARSKCAMASEDWNSYQYVHTFY